jgi:hypothetical protein
MYGLTVRWSMREAPPTPPSGCASTSSAPRWSGFTGMEGLRFKTWRLRAGEWFEGTYVFATAHARDAFEETFRGQAATAPGTQMIGSPPVAVEHFEVVAVAEGGAGFAAGPGPGAH